MKIILVNPAFNRYGGIKGHGGSMMPLNLCYIASYVRQEHPDIEIKILDSEILGISHEDTLTIIKEFSPDLVGITANTSVFDSIISLTFLLKEQLPKVQIVLGGPHVSALPEQSLLESKVDFVVIGEGELTFEELVRELKSDRNEWNRIKGLAYKDDLGNIKINQVRELVNDLDIIPFPARDLIDNKLYSPPPTKRVSLGLNTLIATSRGCPHNCGFCAAKVVWTRRVRVRKPEFVIAEIKHCIEKFDIKSFNFTDEFFTADKKRVLEICKLIIKEDLNIAWVCSARAEGLDEEILTVMKEAGCREISFGIESGNPKILKLIDKKLDLNEAERVIKLAKRNGLSTHASYIFGYIGETEETIKDTTKFAKRMNTHVAAFFIASPLPGTELYKRAKEKGYLRSNAVWSDYSPLSNSVSVLNLPNLSNKTIRKWHRKAIKTYYFRFRYILFKLQSIRHWYEIVNLFNGLKIFMRIKK